MKSKNSPNYSVALMEFAKAVKRGYLFCPPVMHMWLTDLLMPGVGWGKNQKEAQKKDMKVSCISRSIGYLKQLFKEKIRMGLSVLIVDY